MKAERLHYEYECLIKKMVMLMLERTGERDRLCHFLMGDLHYKSLITFEERFLAHLQ